TGDCVPARNPLLGPVRCLFEHILKRERCEGRYQQRAFGSLAYAGIAIVNRRIENDLRPTPGLPTVARPHQFDPAKGTHVRLSSAGADGDRFSIPALCPRRPAVIMLWLTINRPQHRRAGGS